MYIDPGTGSYIIQLVVASVLGAFFYMAPAFRSVLGFFTAPFRSKDAEDEFGDDEDDDDDSSADGEDEDADDEESADEDDDKDDK